ncbi:hypothetical protein RCG67_06670 [Kocuria sp. CPCC 205292]|uniref:hypothetical protein n=1 Tax=Kocuria cellulosilytica TaxID=3071451 RepID=UPI0034D59337
MTPDRSLHGHLIAMLVGAALLVLAQLGTWPPLTAFERALSGLTMAAVLIAVSLTVHERRQGGSAGGPSSVPATGGCRSCRR